MKRVLYFRGIPEHEFMASACETVCMLAIKCANTSVCSSKCGLNVWLLKKLTLYVFKTLLL